MKSKLTAWTVIALAACAATIHAGAYAGLFVALVFAALLTPQRLSLGMLRANTVDAELNLNVILDSAITAFSHAMLPLTMFATVFRNVQLQGTNKVEVPYYALETSASRDFDQADGYVFDDDSATSKREVTINKRKYQPLLLTSAEIARYPQLNAEKLGALKGEKLAYDVIQDILSVVTAANFGAAIFTGAASGFDSDDVAEIAGTLDDIPWPLVGRGLLLNSAFNTALMKDSDVKLAYALGDDGVIKDRSLPRLLGFDYGHSAAIPANGENLVGMATFMSAILAAFSPITPAPAVREMLTDYQIATDPVSQISLEYRAWGDPDGDAEKRVIECNYGYAAGEASALKRLVSA